MPETGAPVSRAEAAPRVAGVPLWLKGVGPLILLAGLVAVFLRFGPVGVFRQAFPPVEELSVERRGLHDAFVAIAGESAAREMEANEAADRGEAA